MQFHVSVNEISEYLCVAVQSYGSRKFHFPRVYKEIWSSVTNFVKFVELFFLDARDRYLLTLCELFLRFYV